MALRRIRSGAILAIHHGDPLAMVDLLMAALVAGLDHLRWRKKVSINRAHVDVQAVAAVESRSVDDRRKSAGHILFHHCGLEDALEGPDRDVRVGRRAIAVCMEV